MAAKKSFKDLNPALQFIDGTENAAHTDADAQTDTDVYTHADKYTDTSTDTDVYDDKYTHNHTHTDDDTATHTDSHTDAHTDTDTDDSYILDFIPRNRETKSKRLQLLVRPSTHSRISDIAKSRETSINDVINTILEGYLNANGH